RSLICIPCSALIDDIQACCQIQHISLSGNAFSEHDIELRLFKRRRNLILYNFDSDMVSDHLSALLEGLCPSDVETDRGIEFQRTSSCSRLRVAEHDTDLLTELIDENHNAV